jgi:hypothetical protein
VTTTEPAAPPERTIIGVSELIALVADLQRRATEDPDADLGHTEAWVLIPADYPLPELEALLELGAPYGLVGAYSRAPAGH